MRGREMFHPSIDLGKLSDDELISKTQEVQKKLIGASQTSRDINALNQLNLILELYRMEFAERQTKKILDEHNKIIPDSVIIGEEPEEEKKEETNPLPKVKLWDE